jgi:hypothetical protein
MPSRREVLIAGAAMTAGQSVLSSVAGSQVPRHNAIYGCTLPQQEANAFFGTATEPRLYVTGDEAMIPQSDDRDFDYALAQTLGKISGYFDVAPGFAYYDDYDARNAYATKVKRLNGADGTVLFGRRLLKRCLAGTDNPDISVACICAHEFGHILQYKLGLDQKVGAGQPTVKRIELQADFFAGYFAGRRKIERPAFPAAVFAVTQYGMGDDMIHEPDHHGTPDERAGAIVRGFEVAFRERRPLPDAIQISVNYVSTL